MAKVKPLRVYAFGKLEVQYDQQVVASFPTRHVEELLGYFLLKPNNRHSREKLMGILWPNSSLSKSRNRLNTVLWRLRTLFNKIGLPTENCFPATREWVSFSPQCPLHIDAEIFQQKINQAKKVHGEEREQTLLEALNLYKGGLFEGIYSDWCLVERERLARLYLYAKGQIMAYCQQCGRFAEAAEWGQAILHDDPLREEVHRAIMRCYCQLGCYALAVKQFQLCTQLLEDELDVLPLPETIAIYQAIVAKRVTTVFPDNAQVIHKAFNQFQHAADQLNQLLDNIA
jgi:DNA-binding SARP family transcriptional activator